MEIPPEVIIKGAIRPGSVYYFPNEKLTSHDSHYFVVINLNPYTEQVILLVCGSSQIATVKHRNIINPPETLIEVSPTQYPLFSEATIFDCNNSVFEHPIDDLIQRLSSHRLECCIMEMPLDVVQQLRNGILSSRLIAPHIKELLASKPSH